MKRWNTALICLFVAFCILLNICGKTMASRLQLMFWFDAFGTVLSAYVGGPVCGCIVGFASNLIYGMTNNVPWFYGLTSLAAGLIVGFAAKKKKLASFFGTMSVATMTTVASVLISVPLNLIFMNGSTGNLWGDGVIGFFRKLNCPNILAVCLGEFYIDFSDKTVTLITIYAVLKLNHILRERTSHETVGEKVEKLEKLDKLDKLEELEKLDKLEEKAAHPELSQLVAWVLAFLLAGLITVDNGAARAEGGINPGDYIQTIYSSNNGLPCGEANDIAETQDGIIWIGTYAGLYRYNGSEFRRMDSYDSVRNVNCLYVDEEGRLWIGTNDNGLSIAIDETVVNVIDQEKGLPANSVRSIIKGSDGYYYIGTTGGMQVLTLNSGLKKIYTLSEINYSDNSSADSNGHVAAIASGGRMFLMSRGQIQSALRLVEGKEQFNCCLFDSEGMLLAGTSTNHIYRYDISTGGFERIGAWTCEGLSSINDLQYLEDGILFVTADNGVGYLDTQNHFHGINTNEFNDSIDHMLVDYQGNYWFTSSRLGLLRMARSLFKDVYRTLGMANKVVNAVGYWQGNYCIGTDRGLDIIDGDCKAVIRNDLTAQLDGIRIRCLMTDQQDHIWICTYGEGLIEVEPDGTQHQYGDAGGELGNRVRLVTELRDGTVIAVGDKGLSFIRDHEIEDTIRYSDGEISAVVLSVIEQDNGRILAGTDGDGIAVIEDGQVIRVLNRGDGLTSGVVLRLVPDPKGQGVFIVTSNGLCFMDANERIRALDRFPYYNNYDIWAKDTNTLYVTGSAGVYVVDRDELLEGDGELNYDLLDGKRGLSSALTANAWNYDDGKGTLYLPCDTGVYVIDTNHSSAEKAMYRMSIPSVRLDGELRRTERGAPIVADRQVSKIELYPEIINYTIQDPRVGYRLDGFDAGWTITSRNDLTSIVYTNLPAGEYKLHLAAFDSNRDEILAERQYTLISEKEIYDNVWFIGYVILVGMLALTWIAIYILTTRVRHRLEIQQREIEMKDRQLEMGNQTILAIANTVDAKDVRTSRHSLRVSIYSKMIGKEMGLSDEDCSNLEKAARMHDIGKIGIPDVILNKPSRLTEEEYAITRSHVIRGAEILKGFTLIDHVVDGAKYHHERYDGKGYPNGLKGEEIPLYGRIIGVADAFDAMTANRVYRKQMDFDYVLDEMRIGRGTQFDPKIVDILLKLIEDGKIDLHKLYSSNQEKE